MHRYVRPDWPLVHSSASGAGILNGFLMHFRHKTERGVTRINVQNVLKKTGRQTVATVQADSFASGFRRYLNHYVIQRTSARNSDVLLHELVQPV